MNPNSNKGLDKNDFIKKRIVAEVRSEDDAIKFLIRIFQALGAEIIDYRNRDEGKFHGQQERGKDIVVKYNSFLNTYIGIQVKYQAGLTKEITESQMSKHLIQLQSTIYNDYQTDNQTISVNKVYLIIFGGVNQSALSLFSNQTKNINIPCEVWTIMSIIKLINSPTNWELLIDRLGWKSAYEVWYDLASEHNLGEISFQVQEYSPEIKLKIFNKQVDFRLGTIPNTGFFLQAYKEFQALYYYGYQKELRDLQRRKIENFCNSIGHNDLESIVPVYKVVGKSGIGKTSFLRAGVFREFVLNKSEYGFLPIALKIPNTAKDEEDFKLALKEKFEELKVQSLFRSIFKKTKYRFILILDQFEQLLNNIQNIPKLFLSIVELAHKYQWQIVIGVRDDFLFETNSYLKKVSTEVPNKIKIDFEDTYLYGLSPSDAEKYLQKFEAPILKNNITRILGYLIEPNSIRAMTIDPARMQILVHFLHLMDFESKETNTLPNEEFLENFENMYLGLIFNKHHDYKSHILDILLRFAITRDYSNKVTKKPFQFDQLISGLRTYPPSELEDTLSILVENRLLYRFKEGHQIFYELTHDRIAHNIVYSYNKIYSDIEVLAEIESFIDNLGREQYFLPDKNTIEKWLNRIDAIQTNKEEKDYVNTKLIVFTYFLTHITSLQPRLLSDIKIEVDDNIISDLSEIIKHLEQIDHIIKGLEFLGQRASSNIVTRFIKQFIEKTEDYNENYKEIVNIELIKSISEYSHEWTPEIHNLITDAFNKADETKRSLIAKAVNNVILSNIERNQSFNFHSTVATEELVTEIIRYCEINDAIIEILNDLLNNQSLLWQVCETIIAHSISTVNDNPEKYRVIKQAFLPKLTEIYVARIEWRNLDETPCDHELRDFYYLLRTMTALSFEAGEDELIIALYHKDHRIRKIAGMLYIQSATENDIENLINILVKEKLPKRVSRGGTGEEAFGLRQSLYELLKQIGNEQLRISDSTKKFFSVLLRVITSEKLDAIVEMYDKTQDYSNEEVKEHDIYDEDLTVILLGLLSSVNSWSNIDIFLRTLNPPVSEIGAFDLPEEGLISIMKILHDHDDKLNVRDKALLKEKIKPCFLHRHNGVCGRAVKVYRQLGDLNDLKDLRELEAHTIQYVRENGLLARNKILERYGDLWGNYEIAVKKDLKD